MWHMTLSSAFTQNVLFPTIGTFPTNFPKFNSIQKVFDFNFHGSGVKIKCFSPQVKLNELPIAKVISTKPLVAKGISKITVVTCWVLMSTPESQHPNPG